MTVKALKLGVGYINVKSIPSLKAHRAAMTSVYLALSQTTVFTLRDHR